METMAEAPGTVQYTSDDGIKCIIPQKDIYEAERNLGIQLAPTGQWNTEFAFRYKQLQIFGGRLSSAPFTKYDMETINQSQWVPISQFCLPLTQFSKEQCEQYMRLS